MLKLQNTKVSTIYKWHFFHEQMFLSETVGAQVETKVRLRFQLMEKEKTHQSCDSVPLRLQ